VEDIPHLLRHRYVADDFKKERVQEFASLMVQPEIS
jgi:hypothetical protein